MHSSTNNTTTLSRMNSFLYAEHVTVFSLMFTTACCLAVGLGLGLGLGSGLGSGYDVVSDCEHLFVLLLIVVVTLPHDAVLQ